MTDCIAELRSLETDDSVNDKGLSNGDGSAGGCLCLLAILGNAISRYL